jgi:hypothetical protein
MYSPQITSCSSQGMRVLRQCKLPREEVIFFAIQHENFRPWKKEMNKAVTMLPNCPMFAVRLWITMPLYRWPIGSLPSTCIVCTPTALHWGRLLPAGINSWSVDCMYVCINVCTCVCMYSYVRMHVACCTVKMLEQKLLTSNNRRSEIQRKRRNAKLRVEHFETFTQIPEFTPSCGVISNLTDYLFIFEGHCIPKLQTELWRHGCWVECPGNSQRLRHLPWVRHEIRRVLCRYPKLVAPSWLQAAQLQLWL